jgi:hypothetical protein
VLTERSVVSSVHVLGSAELQLLNVRSVQQSGIRRAQEDAECGVGSAMVRRDVLTVLRPDGQWDMHRQDRG